MRGVYIFWKSSLFFLNFFKFSLEKLYSLFNIDLLFNRIAFTKLPTFYKLYLIIFYGKLTNTKTNYSNIIDINTIPYLRLKYFLILHKIHNVNKTKYIVNINYINMFKNVKASGLMDAPLKLILISYAVRYYKLSAQQIYWKKPIQSPNFILAFVLEHLTSYKSFYKFNYKTPTGFIKNVNRLSLYTANSPFYVLNKRFFLETNQIMANNVQPKGFVKTTTYLNTIKQYNTFYKQRLGLIDTKYFNTIIIANFFLKIKESIITVSNNFKENVNTYFPVKYKPTDVALHNTTNSNNTITLFIRKNKIFNKGRYSRNRQLYRTGVYWCIWLNIIAVFGLYYYFYRFVFNFGYIWLPILVFVYSIFGSRLVKYRLYNPVMIMNEIKSFILLSTDFFYSILNPTVTYFTQTLKKFSKSLRILLKLLK